MKQRPFKPWVAGSSPARLTTPYRDRQQAGLGA